MKVGDKVRMTKNAHKELFPMGTSYRHGIVTAVYNNLDEIRVKRYMSIPHAFENFKIPYRGHENTVWLIRWWRKI